MSRSAKNAGANGTVRHSGRSPSSPSCSLVASVTPSAGTAVSMLSFLVRRLLYVPLILFGVMLLTFFVSFIVQTPEQRARAVLDKRATPQAIGNYLHERGYDKPRFINTRAGDRWWDSIFFNEMGKLIRFDLGRSDITREPLGAKFLAGAGPSLAITMPAALLGL